MTQATSTQWSKALLFAATSSAALLPGAASSEVFLQGNYVEVGIHNSFSFGTAGTQPPGFHGNQGGQLGFVADYGRDGWDVGTPPFSGDFFLPGSPEEGWGVEWTSASGAERSFNNFGRMGNFGVPMTSLVNTSSGRRQSAIWEGTAVSGDDKLRITQTVSFDADDLFFVMNVNLVNIGTTTLRSVEYMRNVDPDQEQPWTGNFTTSNWVEFQPPRPASGSRSELAARPAGNTHKALAIAQGLKYGLTLGLGSIDPRAVVAASQGFSNRDTDAILNTPIQPLPTSPSVADRAIALAYDLGDLAPGQSVSFDYVYILDAADLETALGALAAATILQPTGTISGTSVIFQATTDDVPNTTSMDFYVGDTLVGTDLEPDAGGIFEVSFDSMGLPNGPVTLRIAATMASGEIVEKSATVTVGNDGPPVAFLTPVMGQAFNGAGIPVEIDTLDPLHLPVRVSFFRESASSGSIALGEDTSGPFTAVFGVEDLPEGESVIIKAVATDALGRSTTIQVAGVVVLNRAPVADAGPDQVLECTGESSATVTLNGSNSSDPDGDVLNFVWSGIFGTLTGASPTTSLPLGLHLISLTVNDGMGGTDSDTVSVTVEDTLPPVVHAGSDVIIEATSIDGAAYAITPTVSDACGSPTSEVVPALSIYPLGSTLVTVSATDGSGNSASDTVTVTVRDTTAPVLTVPGPVVVNATGLLTPVELGEATATDLFPVTITNDAPEGGFEPGVTQITWTATDSNGNQTTAVQQVTVLGHGFVTGGGWFSSPAGAFMANPGLTGKVNFGFVSKYHNGATVPTGQAELHFNTAGLKFHTVGYEWLVAEGSKAQFKAVGTINGSGSYSLVLTSIESTGKREADRVRVKIWDQDTGAVVYDSQGGAALHADPTTPLGGGSITIHKAK